VAYLSDYGPSIYIPNVGSRAVHIVVLLPRLGRLYSARYTYSVKEQWMHITIRIGGPMPFTIERINEPARKTLIQLVMCFPTL
jgi:hypothetical protein